MRVSHHSAALLFNITEQQELTQGKKAINAAHFLSWIYPQAGHRRGVKHSSAREAFILGGQRSCWTSAIVLGASVGRYQKLKANTTSVLTIYYFAALEGTACSLQPRRSPGSSSITSVSVCIDTTWHWHHRGYQPDPPTFQHVNVIRMWHRKGPKLSVNLYIIVLMIVIQPWPFDCQELILSIAPKVTSAKRCCHLRSS